ncbi:unnamed protein product [Lepeophtheirus salmonis]|uniref:(salmon louse) hypothetical protein n=1 Tax=Lepeophtheirus salmonis TaxID=72036 RepID=A0A7R8CVW3_LEPSM|nr:unnamed protein product [Lepeophtheirus salmonis]CAF2914864.1 unnamed protein product [Lepeophtheirus salmonis]
MSVQSRNHQGYFSIQNFWRLSQRLKRAMLVISSRDMLLFSLRKKVQCPPCRASLFERDSPPDIIIADSNQENSELQKLIEITLSEVADYGRARQRVEEKMEASTARIIKDWDKETLVRV